MEIILALLSGIIVTVMISLNGGLSNSIGLYFSFVVIHLFGLIPIYVFCKIKKIKLFFQNIPFYYYLGGLIGVFTVIFNCLTIGQIGASLVTSLGLLGQICTSIVLEQKGYLGSLQSKFNLKKALCLAIIALGIGVMI